MTAKKNTNKVDEPKLDEIGVVEPTPPSDHTAENKPLRGKVSFGRTYYYVDPARTRADKGPNQLKGLVKWMLDHDVTSPENALQGAEIGERAVKDGYVVTAKLTGPVIFAYYIRRMEKEFGVEHAKTLHAKTGHRMH